MATADLLTIIIEVILWRLSYYYFYGTFLDMTQMCIVIHVAGRAATDCSVWFTVFFTFDRFVAICCQKMKAKYCTGKAAAVVLTTTGILLCCKNIPLYFIYEAGKVINNVAWDCFRKPSAYTDPGWVGYDWLATVLTPLLPFVLIMLLNTLTVRHILVASRVRKGLRIQSNGDKRSDPEMESRRRSAILLFTISGSFIVLWSLLVADFIYYTFSGADPRNYTVSEYIFQHVGDILMAVSCCTNTFIYGVTQSKFREQLMNAARYPLTSIIQMIHNRNN
ncbi:compound eye opsin BCRH2-like [Leucoraja erinacea]|uniref:compound eye opsin BCRH2-like n=1 Tax=Leucoraja erinaceus TaxID=7782 RepID=UPI002453B3A9|nr:compound eye opsin BCRH2-like [Leucoraja erinacea]